MLTPTRPTLTCVAGPVGLKLTLTPAMKSMDRALASKVSAVAAPLSVSACSSSGRALNLNGRKGGDREGHA